MFQIQRVLDSKGLVLDHGSHVVSSLRVQVTMTTLADLPARVRRSANALITGLQRIAETKVCGFVDNSPAVDSGTPVIHRAPFAHKLHRHNTFTEILEKQNIQGAGMRVLDRSDYFQRPDLG